MSSVFYWARIFGPVSLKQNYNLALGKRFMLKIFSRIIIFIGALFNATVVFASDYGLGAAKPDNLPTGLDLPSFIGKILGSALGFVGTIFFVLIVYAGLTWMMSAGNEEVVTRAKKILTAAIIGLVIVLSAYAITTFIGTNL